MLRNYLPLLAAMFLFAGMPAVAQSVPDTINTSYFPVLPFDAPSDASPQLVPVTVNHALDGSHAGITSAIVVIHDFQRNGQASVAALSEMAGANNATTIIIGPQFMIDFDIARYADRLPEHGRMFARWSLGGWDDGGDSVTQPPEKPVSSFTVIDLILLYLGDKQFFPDLRQMTIAGHGAGADFVQRYAVMGRAIPLLEKQNLPVRFLVANASSYMYFTNLRPRSGRQLGFVTADAAACANFNAYGYGLDGLNDYARRVGASDMKLNYSSRNVTYIVGEKASASDPVPDTSCAAMIEGPDRTTRAMYYGLYLYQLYGADIAKKQKFITIPKAGYDPSPLFGSPCGMSVLFGNGVCETETPGFTRSGNSR